MKVVYILSFILILLYTKGCNCNRKENKSTKKGDEVLLNERLDTLFIESFLSRYEEYNPYKKMLYKFYSARDYQLAWSDSGELLPQADMFVNVIEDLSAYGIEESAGRNYNIRDTILNLKDVPYSLQEQERALKELDLILTAEYMHNTPKLWQGVINPAEDDSIEWYIERKRVKYSQMLDSILKSKPESNLFISYAFLHPQFFELKKILKKYRAIEQNGGWPKVSLHQEQLSRGDTGESVRELKQRLLMTGDMVSYDTRDFIYDVALEQGVRKFQERHGLKSDGIVDSTTLYYLNIPVSDKLKQILLNMERWRWMPQPMGQNYVLVNIPDFKLTIYEEDKPVETMKIIVGKTGSNTVIFSGRIKYVVVNPYWNIPKNIAVNEILPKIKKDPGYLNLHNMEVGVNWNFSAVDQEKINWKTVTKENFNFTLRQKSGADNPLGKIKFLFPNQFLIYLHDTPDDQLFSERSRGFSHGCIRLEKPLVLAEYLLRNNSFWTIEKINELINSGENEWITLDKPVPVYLLYFTVWIDEKGSAQFRNDYYGHDAKLAQRLFEED